MIYDFDISLQTVVPTFDVILPIQISSDVEIPIITDIDGGDSGPDDQFTPINGLLDGGS